MPSRPLGQSIFLSKLPWPLRGQLSAVKPVRSFGQRLREDGTVSYVRGYVPEQASRKL